MKIHLLVLLGLCGLLSGCGGGSSPKARSLQPLVITSSAPPSGTTGTPYSGFALTASGGVTPYIWSWAPTSGSTLPPGLTFSNGFISGTPTTAGTYNVVVTITDSHIPAAQKSVSYTIKITAGALVITSGTPPAGITGEAYGNGGFSLTASGGSAPYSWNWAPAQGSSLPPGLTLSNGLISGTPTAAGTYNVIVTVADSQSPAAQTSTNYAITIARPLPLQITSGNPPGGTVGNIYAFHGCGPFPGPAQPCGGFDLSASGGVTPYSWSWVGAQGSSTPPGLHITSIRWRTVCTRSGWEICGTPTTIGTYSVVVTVSDSASPQNQVTANYSIVIKNPPPPVINLVALPVGVTNLPYSFTFTVKRGFFPSPQPLTWSETGALPPGLTLPTNGVLSGTPTATGSYPITVTVMDGLGQNSAPVDFTIVIDAHGFKATTGSMSIARASHTATLLQNGRVLVAGGVNTSGDIISAEIYDPNTQSFSPTNNMLHLRPEHTATLLKDGRVLIAGGNTNTAEIYTPSSGAFVATGSMSTSRSGHSATLLPDGSVLIAGGDAAGTAELFNPSNATFTATSNMSTPRSHHTATLLNNGLVLVTGGFGTNGSLASAELYDPSSGHFTTTGSMAFTRTVHAATLLNNNTVLITGGVDSSSNTVPIAAEIYNPASSTFSNSGNMVQGVFSHTATLLPNGQVLVAGGIVPNGVGVFTAELYDPASGTFKETGSLTSPRYEHTATLLNDGTVLVVGGRPDGGTVVNTAELYQ